MKMIVKCGEDFISAYTSDLIQISSSKGFRLPNVHFSLNGMVCISAHDMAKIVKDLDNAELTKVWKIFLNMYKPMHSADTTNMEYFLGDKKETICGYLFSKNGYTIRLKSVLTNNFIYDYENKSVYSIDETKAVKMSGYKNEYEKQVMIIIAQHIFSGMYNPFEDEYAEIKLKKGKIVVDSSCKEYFFLNSNLGYIYVGYDGNFCHGKYTVLEPDINALNKEYTSKMQTLMKLSGKTKREIYYGYKKVEG